MPQAEQIARAAKEAFDAAQLLENGEQERVNALRLVRETLAAAKSDILHANSLDMEVCIAQLLLCPHIWQFLMLLLTSVSATERLQEI